MVVRSPVPQTTASVSTDTGGVVGQLAEYREDERQVRWAIKKFVGGSEQTLRARITLSAPCTSTVRKELGPVTMNFEMPMYNVSNVQVRFFPCFSRIGANS